MKAQLIESEDEHHWVLLDHRVTQLVIDRASVRVQTWSLDGSADIRLAAPFALQLASGAVRRMDPARTDSLAPCLALLGLGIRSVTISRAGILTIAFSDASVLSVAHDPRRAAWDVQGGGVLEGMIYAAGPEGIVPWG